MDESLYANRYASILYRTSQRFLARALREAGLPLECTQLPVFLRAAQIPGIAQEEIASLTGFDKATVARAAAALESAGLVCRRPDPADRRVLRVALTPAGTALVPRVRTVIDALHAEIYRGISADDRAAACRLLARMCDNLRGAVDPPAPRAPKLSK